MLLGMGLGSLALARRRSTAGGVSRKRGSSSFAGCRQSNMHPDLALPSPARALPLSLPQLHPRSLDQRTMWRRSKRSAGATLRPAAAGDCRRVSRPGPEPWERIRPPQKVSAAKVIYHAVPTGVSGSQATEPLELEDVKAGHLTAEDSRRFAVPAVPHFDAGVETCEPRARVNTV